MYIASCLNQFKHIYFFKHLWFLYYKNWKSLLLASEVYYCTLLSIDTVLIGVQWELTRISGSWLWHYKLTNFPLSLPLFFPLQLIMQIIILFWILKSSFCISQVDAVSDFVCLIEFTSQNDHFLSLLLQMWGIHSFMVDNKQLSIYKYVLQLCIHKVIHKVQIMYS